MKLTTYTDVAVFEALRDEWNGLLARSSTNTVFCTWEWQTTWWNVYQAGELWVTACHAADGQLVGIAPWFIQQYEGERVVRTIGCVDVTDYVDIIADVDHSEAVQAALAQLLAENHARYDRINLCNIPEASPTVAMLPEKLEQHGFAAEVVFQEVCPIIPLPDSWEAYLESLDKKNRHELRRKIRRAEGEANLEYHVVGPEHDLDAEIDRFLKLMASSQPAKAEFLSDAKNLAFMKTIIQVMHRQGWLRLSLLLIDRVPVAAYCDFDYCGQVLVYNSGLMPDLHPHLSPGIVLLCYNIRHAIETRHHVFDFLRGNENYKYRMGGQDTKVFKLRARMNGGEHRD